MKRFVLFALLAAALGVLATARDARSHHHPVHYRVVYAPFYHCPPPFYYYRPAASMRPVVEVAADEKGFDPKSVDVAPGTTVRWTNRGKAAHTVTSRDGLWDSGPIPPGSSYTVTFLRPGTYHYFCRPHEKKGMVGTVVVGQGGHGGHGGGSGGGGGGY